MTGALFLRVGGMVVAALSAAVLLASGPAAIAEPSAARASANGCSAVLNGYKPHLAATYLTDDAKLYVTDIKEKTGGEISGEFDVGGNPAGAGGTFTGTVSDGDVSMKATFSGFNALGISKLSFTGKIGCFLTLITTDSLTTDPPNLLSKKWTLDSSCPDLGAVYPSGPQIACSAEQIRDQKDIPYVNGGGHGQIPGPTKKKVDGERKLGLDCSGFTRWVYYLEYGVDVLSGPNWGTTVDQWKLTKRVSQAKAGELVFFTKQDGTVTHVGIILGEGYMLDEPHTNSSLRAESISGFAKKEHEKVVYRHLGLDE